SWASAPTRHPRTTDTIATRVKTRDHPALDIARIRTILLSPAQSLSGNERRCLSNPRGCYDGVW
ncbi:MAG: hypothetical protein VX288_06880, partial [Planctomycetota bacterium]|nr:hypothetical protein [Planctomycetota bacterium]